MSNDIAGTGTTSQIPVEAADLRARQHRLLADCDLLDVPEDAELDAITRLASAVTGFPITMINLLDTERTCQLTSFGIPKMNVERDTSLCNRASLIGGVVTSTETTTDPRFSDLPWVDGRWANVRRYASAPLLIDGLTIGTLCIFDQEPGPALVQEDVERLSDLASVIVALLERRRHNRRIEAARELAQAHEDVLRARAFERALLDALPVGVVAAGPDRRVSLFNDVSRRWHGRDADSELSPDDLGGAYDLFEADGTTALAPDRVPLLRVFDEGSISEAEIVIHAGSDEARTVSCTGKQVRDGDGRLLGAVVAMADVTAQRALEAQLREAATHDALTGLPNRSLLMDRLDMALSEASRTGNALALLFLDLDGFKNINDTHGHDAGDAVLVETASRISEVLRAGDTAARLGGDEFVLVCPRVTTARQAEMIVRRLTETVAAPITFQGAEYTVGVSIGLATSHGNDTADDLLAQADQGMYAAKRSRRADRGATSIPAPR